MLPVLLLSQAMLCYVMLCIEAGPLRGEPVDLAIWFAPVPHPTKR